MRTPVQVVGRARTAGLGSTVRTSSMISVRQAVIPAMSFAPWALDSWRIFLTISLQEVSPVPRPSAEWSVHATIFSAAAPVDAVTSGARTRSRRILSKNDLPVPGAPMRSTLSRLCSTAWKTSHCDALSPGKRRIASRASLSVRRSTLASRASCRSSRCEKTSASASLSSQLQRPLPRRGAGRGREAAGAPLPAYANWLSCIASVARRPATSRKFDPGKKKSPVRTAGRKSAATEKRGHFFEMGEPALLIEHQAGARKEAAPASEFFNELVIQGRVRVSREGQF